MGAIPGLPKVHLHNPDLAYEVGDDFLKYYYQAEQGLIDPYVLVVEGSIPNEDLLTEGYWAAVGYDPMTMQPITTNEYVQLTAEFTRWKAIRPARWVWRIISAGISNRL